MRCRRGSVFGALAIVTIGITSACSPSATGGLTYQDVDRSVLRDSLVVVATSRADTTTAGMLGSTVLVDSGGTGRRIDNQGMDEVRLDYREGVIAFADLRHDYLLGTDEPVRRRAAVPDSLYMSFLMGQDRLVSLFNDGFGDDGYRLVVADPALKGGLREELGYVSSAVRCGDTVWVVANPDLQQVSPTSSMSVRRIDPRGGAAWTIEAGAEISELSIDTATCERGRLVAVGNTADGAERSRPVIATVDLATGESRVVAMTGSDTEASIDPEDSWGFTHAAVRGERVLLVAQPGTSDTDAAELWRVDIASGRKTTVSGLRGSDDSSDLLFRFDGDTLYVLDATEEDPSVLTAISLEDGAVIGRRTIDPLLDQVNGRFTSFEESQVVRDFVVLTPVERW